MNRMERFSAWRARNVLPLDVLGTLAIAFFTVGLAASTGNTPGILFAHDPTSQMVWSLVSLVPVMFRRWRPQAAALCYAGLVALHLVFGPAMLYSDFLSLVMVYSVIVYGDPRNTKAFIVLAAAFGLFATMAITWSVDVGPMFGQVWDGYRQMYYGACSTLYQEGFSGECASTLLVEGFQMGLLVAACLGATIVLAYWQRARQATIRMLRERNEAIAARQDEERHIAALAERARIARDMHDVVAHTLSIIIVQSDGGRYAGAGNPEVARSTMETIRRESERALHDMKRLLGVFGGSSHADYDDIAALVDQARETSPDTAIVRRVEGTAAPQRLGAQASMAVYRVVQEALTNVRKYAGPRPTVRIDERWDDDGLSLTIADNGRGASSGLDGHAPGYGLIGMRERVQAVGGTVSAGPGIGGGFVVSVTVPYAAARTPFPRPPAMRRRDPPASPRPPFRPRCRRRPWFPAPVRHHLPTGGTVPTRRPWRAQRPCTRSVAPTQPTLPSQALQPTPPIRPGRPVRPVRPTARHRRPRRPPTCRVLPGSRCRRSRCRSASCRPRCRRSPASCVPSRSTRPSRRAASGSIGSNGSRNGANAIT